MAAICALPLAAGAAGASPTVPASQGVRGTVVMPTGPSVDVIVLASGGVAEARRAVQASGGTAHRALGIVGGISATVPATALAALQLRPGVTSVSPDRKLSPKAIDPVTGYDAQGDTGSMSSVTRLTGAQDLWAAGLTGRGVDVALIDTGVAPVPGIQADQLLDGPDLSFDSQSDAPLGVDQFGHGTHMAGIIAGHDDGVTSSAAGCTTCLNSSGYSDTTKFVGMAPEAGIVNVKVGAYDGGTDVSQVIAALDWVVQHRTDNGANIKVVNLSFGLASTNPYTVDPLAYAAEVAWQRGLLVVAAGGNDGTDASQPLNSPAYDPYVVAVGSDDPRGTLAVQDDTISDFSNSGTAERGVDVVAPGAHVISLRVPGSYIDTNDGSTGRVGTRFFRGSGTSQATATVSGLAALLYQKWPDATPDEMKKAILDGTRHLPQADRTKSGEGLVDGAKTAQRPLRRGPATQSWVRSTGTGSLEAARGGSHVSHEGVELTGEQDIFGQPWDGQRWSSGAWAGTTWQGGQWLGQRWSGDGWEGQRWSGQRWSGQRWSGQRWSGQRWSGQRWSGSIWDGQRWSGQRWSSMAWDGQRWSGDGWSGQRWSGQRWSGQRWSGQRWSGQRWSTTDWG